VIRPALVGVGVCAASVLAAMGVGLLLGRTAEGLLGRRRRDRAGTESSAEES
jgi:hypothetical protein